jgi:uncharacterized membrane protein
MTALESDRLALLEEELSALSERVSRLEAERQVAWRRTVGSAPARPRPTLAPARAVPAAVRLLQSWPPASGGRSLNLEDLLGRRLLALVGGVAVLAGAAFLVAVAVERGWIGEGMRVLLALLGSTALLAAGVWLYERRGRLQAALAMVGTAIGALYLTVAAAGALYDLIPVPGALAAAAAVGALATALALLWNSRTVAGLGLGGALLAPVLVDALTTVGIAFLALSFAAASAVLVWRRWRWLAVGAFAAAASQLAVWSFEPRPVAHIVFALATFSALNLVAALGHELRAGSGAVDQAAALLASAGGLVFAAVGYIALPHGEGELAGGIWLSALAAAHLVAASAALAPGRRRIDLALLLLGIALALADAAFALLADGWLLPVGWAASALLVAAAYRRWSPPHGELVRLTLTGQLTLAIVHALLFEAPPGDIVNGMADGATALAVLAAIGMSAFGSARLSVTESSRWRLRLDGISLAALVYATAAVLDGALLVLAWTAQATFLAQVARRAGDSVARGGALALLALAVVHALAFEAPPSALVYGAGDLAMAALALAAVAAAAFRCSQLEPFLAPQERPALEAISAAALLYLASIAIVTPFQPGGGALDTGLALGVRQQGQVLLSGFWAACGFAALFLGLRRNKRRLRLAGFGLLALAVAKVFVFDLATLASLYRVLSLVALGLLLLAGAFAYQRMRPPAPASTR